MSMLNTSCCLGEPEPKRIKPWWIGLGLAAGIVLLVWRGRSKLITATDVTEPEGSGTYIDDQYNIDTSIGPQPIETDVGYTIPVAKDLSRVPQKNLDTLTRVSKQAAEEFGVPAEWLIALAIVESTANPRAQNKSGATGLWQFKPGTAAFLGYRGTVEGLFDPLTSARLAAKAILYYQKRALTRCKREATFEDICAMHNAGHAFCAETAPARTQQRYIPEVIAQLPQAEAMLAAV